MSLKVLAKISALRGWKKIASVVFGLMAKSLGWRWIAFAFCRVCFEVVVHRV